MKAVRLAVALLCGATIVPPHAAKTATESPVQVTVSTSTSRAGTTYRYRLVNGGPSGIYAFCVGWSGEGAHADLELTAWPGGWDGMSTSAPGVRSPAKRGWNRAIVREMHGTRICVCWGNVRSTARVKPGASLEGFAVTVPHPDHAYESGHWTAFADGQRAFAGRLRPRRMR